LQPWLHGALRYLFNRQTRVVELADFESNPTTVKAALDLKQAYHAGLDGRGKAYCIGA
jgi:hypothetical protein